MEGGCVYGLHRRCEIALSGGVGDSGVDGGPVVHVHLSK